MFYLFYIYPNLLGNSNAVHVQEIAVSDAF